MFKRKSESAVTYCENGQNIGRINILLVLILCKKQVQDQFEDRLCIIMFKFIILFLLLAFVLYVDTIYVLFNKIIKYLLYRCLAFGF